MKLICYKTVTTTSKVEIELDDDADDKRIEYEARVARELHGFEIITEEEKHWYVKQDEEDVPKFGHPLYD